MTGQAHTHYLTWQRRWFLVQTPPVFSDSVREGRKFGVALARCLKYLLLERIEVGRTDEDRQPKKKPHSLCGLSGRSGRFQFLNDFSQSQRNFVSTSALS